MPNNRELSILIWFVVALALALTQPSIRRSVRGLLTMLASPRVATALLLMAVWVAGELWVGRHLGLWRSSLVTGTLMWFVVSAFVSLVNSLDASRKPGFLKRGLIAAFELSILAELLTGAVVLPLLAELLLVPVLVGLAMLVAFSGTDVKHRPAYRVFLVINVTIGAGMALYVVSKLVLGWSDIDKTNLLLQALLPIWLTIGLIPFVYAFALYAAYELVFQRIDWRSRANRAHRLRLKAAVVQGFHGRAHDLGKFNGPWQMRIADAGSFAAARAVIQEFRSGLRATGS